MLSKIRLCVLVGGVLRFAEGFRGVDVVLPVAPAADGSAVRRTLLMASTTKHTTSSSKEPVSASSSASAAGGGTGKIPVATDPTLIRNFAIGESYDKGGCPPLGVQY